MAKAKKSKLTIEDALVPVDEQEYDIPNNWIWIYQNIACQLSDGEKKSGEEYPYLEVKYLRGNIDAEIKDSGKFITSNTKVILVDGENSGEVFEVLEDGYMGSTFKVLNISEGINEKYLLYYVDSKRELLRNNKTGSAIPHLNKKLFFSLGFPLPPLAEQERIVEQIENLFTQLDEAKEKAQLVVDNYEVRKTAIMYKAFTGELTAKWREEKGISTDTWKEKTLQEVCVMKITDGTHKTPTYCEENEGIPFISAKDVNGGFINWENIKYIPHTLHEELYSRLAPQVDDVLLSKNGAKLGVAAIVDCEKIFDIYVTLALLRPNTDIILPRFLLNIINSPICRRQIDNHLTGIGMPNLHLRDIKEILISIPTLEEQAIIIEIVDNLNYKENQVKNSAEYVIEKIEELKKSILAKAFRGELGTNIETEESALELLKSILK